jgi:hypothetical protein
VGPIVTASAEQPALNGGPMLECSGMPCVTATVAGGKQLRMLIDTGNVNSILDAAVAQKMGLTVTPLQDGDGKLLEGYGKARLTGVSIGDAQLGDVTVLVMDIAAYQKRDRMPAADGTFAYTAFKNRLLELDYRRKMVRFSERLNADPSCPGFCGELSYPTFGKNGPPIVVATGFRINNQPLTVQIDTLFEGTMLVYDSSVEKLGLKAQAASTQHQFFKYTDNGVNMIESQAATESFGPRALAANAALFFATPGVHQPDGLFDGTAGHGLFEKTTLSLDFRSNRIWVS